MWSAASWSNGHGNKLNAFRLGAKADPFSLKLFLVQYLSVQKQLIHPHSFLQLNISKLLGIACCLSSLIPECSPHHAPPTFYRLFLVNPSQCSRKVLHLLHTSHSSSLDRWDAPPGSKVIERQPAFVFVSLGIGPLGLFAASHPGLSSPLYVGCLWHISDSTFIQRSYQKLTLSFLITVSCDSNGYNLSLSLWAMTWWVYQMTVPCLFLSLF